MPVRIPIENMNLQGDLHLPSNPLGLVIFVHGSGSSRFSPRNRFVAEELNKQGFATLLLDLLTEEEHRIDTETMEYRFNIPLLASRSTLASELGAWPARSQPLAHRLVWGKHRGCCSIDYGRRDEATGSSRGVSRWPP